MATDIGSGRDARTTRGAVIAAGANGTPRQSRAVKRHHRMVMLLIGVNLLRDRRVREQVFLGAITLAALAHLARQSQARARARLIAWLDAEPGPTRAGPTAAQLTSRSGLPGHVEETAERPPGLTHAALGCFCRGQGQARYGHATALQLLRKMAGISSALASGECLVRRAGPLSARRDAGSLASGADYWRRCCPHGAAWRPEPPG